MAGMRVHGRLAAHSDRLTPQAYVREMSCEVPATTNVLKYVLQNVIQLTLAGVAWSAQYRACNVCSSNGSFTSAHCRPQPWSVKTRRTFDAEP